MIQGLWLCVLRSLGNVYWVGFTLHEFGQLPWAISGIGLLLFTLICQPQFYLFAPLWRSLRARFHGKAGKGPAGWRVTALVALASLGYAGLDWILPKLFVDTIGHAFYSARMIRQLADLGGVWLLTFLVFFVNETLLQLWLDLRGTPASGIAPAGTATARARLKRHLPLYAVATVLLAGAWTYGLLRERWLDRYYASQLRTAQRAQIAVIQANIGDFDKLAAESGIRGAADRITETYLRMSNQALQIQPRPDAIVWPETSYPSTFRTPQTTSEVSRDQRVEEFVRTTKTPLWFGGYDRQNAKDFNSFFFLSPSLELQIYHKNILLLFGEYIPGMESIQWLKQMFPQIGNFGRGPGPEVFQLPTSNPALGSVRVSPVICYEALFPSYAIEGARKGSQLILNITNDSWFGPWGEPYTHLSLTVFRSIETRLPQLRSTNTGISTLILPTGELASRTGLFRPEIMNVNVSLPPSPWTLMKAWGDWFGAFAVLAGLVPLLGLLWGPRWRRS